MTQTLLVYRYTADQKRASSAPLNGRVGPAAAQETSADLSRPTEIDSFERDAPTVLSYAALGCFTFWLYAFGPAVTLLRAEWGFSYTLLGLYSVLWAGGAALAGAGFAGAARHLGRGPLLWGSAVGTVV